MLVFVIFVCRVVTAINKKRFNLACDNLRRILHNLRKKDGSISTVCSLHIPMATNQKALKIEHGCCDVGCY